MTLSFVGVRFGSGGLVSTAGLDRAQSLQQRIPAVGGTVLRRRERSKSRRLNVALHSC